MFPNLNAPHCVRQPPVLIRDLIYYSETKSTCTPKEKKKRMWEVIWDVPAFSLHCLYHLSAYILKVGWKA